MRKSTSSRLKQLMESAVTTGITTPLRVILATTAALWLGAAQAQGAPNVPARSGTELRFRDFFKTPYGPKGLEISDVLARADGQQMRMTGYMVLQERPSPGKFLLTPRPVQMAENADGEADDLPAATVLVSLADEQKDWVVPHVRGLIEVKGTVRVGRWEDDSGRVAWVRLELHAEATRGMNPRELAGYIHSLQHRH